MEWVRTGSVGGVESVLDRFCNTAAIRYCQSVFAGPIAHRLHLIAAGRRRTDSAQDRPARLLSGHPGAILDEPSQLPAEAIRILRAQVDFEVGPVKAELDCLDFFGGSVKVVDKEGPSDCCHDPNIPEWPSVRMRLSACLPTISACRQFSGPFAPVGGVITTLSEPVFVRPADQSGGRGRRIRGGRIR